MFREKLSLTKCRSTALGTIMLRERLGQHNVDDLSVAISSASKVPEKTEYHFSRRKFSSSLCLIRDTKKKVVKGE